MKRVGVILLCLALVAISAQAYAKSIHSLRSRQLKAAAPDRAANAEGFLPSELECVTRGTPDNLNLDCDDPVLPNNEPDVEVDPEDPRHIVVSSNDYDSCCDGFYTTFDGGRTWHQGDMSAEDPARIGSDPVTTFDPKSGHVLHSSLNFAFTAEGLTTDGDVVVSVSRDGGLTWDEPVVVGGGRGDDDDPVQIFNDKEWMVTDVDPKSPYYGRTYLTWTAFRSELGVYVESPIMEAHSDDGGLTWSRPQEISGSSRTCTYQEFGAAFQCDEDQFSVPTVTPDGTVYVAFENAQHEAAWEAGELFESQYMVVRSTDGGKSFSKPASIVDLEDGTADYPINVDGRQTLNGYQVRVNSAGNIAADPRSGRLYLVFADNRAGLHDVANPVTNTNVFIMKSKDGRHWSRPTPVSESPRDQWFPWVEVDPTDGTVGVIYHDRSEDPRFYGTTLAESRKGHSWSYTKVADKVSHPRNSLFFRAEVEGCFKCSVFHGDYIGLDYGTDGVANAAWTDMRRFIELDGENGYTENIFFSRVE